MGPETTSRTVRWVFALLVCATFGAFFVAQRLKNSPAALQGVGSTPVFSPNQDGRKERAGISFKLRKADDVTVEMIDDRGDVAATLADDRALKAYTPTSLRWDGRDADHHRVGDGRYRVRITLRREGRSIILPRSIVKDTTPPRVRVTSIGPSKDKAPRPELLPRADGKPADVIFAAPGTDVKVRLFRTTPGSVSEVLLPPAAPDRTGHWAWDGKLNGRPARAGTYLAVAESRDRAGNIGTSVPLTGAARLPRADYGATLPGRGGITVRYVGVQPPAVPTAGGQPADVLIDARQQAWTASLRRVGGRPAPVRRYRGTRPKLRLTVPDGDSGVYLLSVRTARHAQRVPLIVQGSAARAGTPQAPRGVLVVLGVMTWQGRNPIDDDGDGEPNLLDRGVGARLGRVWAGDGLPAGFADHEAPVLAFLDRTGHRYDLTTDVALAGPGTPDLSRYKGVLLAGDARWLPAAVGRRLRAFARAGGKVASLGTESLRRQVRVSPRGRLIDPTAPAATDLFGARLRPIVRRPTALTVFGPDPIGLFTGGNGAFAGVRSYEETAATGRDAQRVATAVTDAGRPVIVAARFGRGLVIRPGLPGFATRLTPDATTAALMGRIWMLLSR